MRIASPSFLLLLWLVPFLAAFYLWSFRRRAQLLEKFASHEMLARLLPSVSRSRQRTKAALLSTAVVMVILALLRPQWGFHWEEITRRGVDIMVAVDVSQSMLAEDVSPNRLERAKRELEDLLDILEGDRIGLIAFAGEAWVQCPLTLDYGAFAMFLDYLDPDLIPVPGTAIAQAIELAQESFVEQSSASRALILVTDGEDHLGNVMEAARKAKEAGIQIYTIGIGADQGAPIPSPDGEGFIQDRNGEVVMTRLDENTLQRVAVETGGAYVRSTSGNLDLERIYTEGIRASLEATELKSTRQKKWEERFQWPLFVAVLILFLEPFVSERGRSRRRRTTPAVAATLLLLCTWSPQASAGLLGSSTLQKALQAYESEDYETALQLFTDAGIERPNDPLIDYNMGNAYYKTRRFQEAETSYLRVIARTADNALRERAYYNLGNTAFRQGKLDQAVEYYQEALKLDPNDMDAKRNLEITRREIQRRLEENRKRQEKQQEAGDQNQQGQQNQPENQQQQGSDQGEKPREAQNRGAEPTPGPDQRAQAEQGAETTPAPSPGTSQGAGGEPTPTPGPPRAAAATSGQDQAQAGNQQDQVPVGQLTREQAERLLSQVPDAQAAGLKALRRGRQGTGVPGGKPW